MKSRMGAIMMLSLLLALSTALGCSGCSRSESSSLDGFAADPVLARTAAEVFNDRLEPVNSVLNRTSDPVESVVAYTDGTVRVALSFSEAGYLGASVGGQAPDLDDLVSYAADSLFSSTPDAQSIVVTDSLGDLVGPIESGVTFERTD